MPGKAVGECIKYGPTKTPGSVIESQLSNVLGSGLRQLELADEFDEMVGALVGQMVKNVVFGAQGLFQSDPDEIYQVDTGPIPPPINIDAGTGSNSGNSFQPGFPGSGDTNDQSQQCLATCQQNFCPSGDAVDPSCNLTGLQLCANACASQSP